MSKGQSDNINNAKKSSIKQRLWTDLGRSVGVTKEVSFQIIKILMPATIAEMIFKFSVQLWALIDPDKAGQTRYQDDVSLNYLVNCRNPH